MFGALYIDFTSFSFSLALVTDGAGLEGEGNLGISRLVVFNLLCFPPCSYGQ